MKAFGELGLRILFSEITNKCHVDHYTDTKCPVPWNETTLQQQEQGFLNLLDICLESEYCDAFQFWGFTDRYSNLDGDLNGLPWDKNMAPKAVVQKMIDRFEKKAVVE